jgi:glutamine cyclotransferase
MKRIIRVSALVILALAMIGLVGCPISTATQQQTANALHVVSSTTAAFQQAEITAYGQGLIPADDHQYIESALLTLGRAGKTADACTKGALTKTGLIGCVNLSIATIDNLNADGALHLKSARAKADFALAMVSVKGVLTTITTMLGGN